MIGPRGVRRLSTQKVVATGSIAAKTKTRMVSTDLIMGRQDSGCSRENDQETRNRNWEPTTNPLLLMAGEPTPIVGSSAMSAHHLDSSIGLTHSSRASAMQGYTLPRLVTARKQLHSFPKTLSSQPGQPPSRRPAPLREACLRTRALSFHRAALLFVASQPGHETRRPRERRGDADGRGRRAPVAVKSAPRL